MSRFSAKPGSVATVAPLLDAAALEAAKAAGLEGEWLPMLVLTQQASPHAVLIVGPDKPSTMLLHALAADQDHDEEDPVRRCLAAVKYALRETFCDSDAAFAVVGYPKGLPIVMEIGTLDFAGASALFREAAKQLDQVAAEHEAAKKATN
jgi:hypothetical protein